MRHKIPGKRCAKTGSYALPLCVAAFCSGLVLSILLHRFVRPGCEELESFLAGLPAAASASSPAANLLRSVVLYFRAAVVILVLANLPCSRWSVLAVPFSQGLLLSHCVCCFAACTGRFMTSVCLLGIRSLFTVGTGLYLISMLFARERTAQSRSRMLFPVAGVLLAGVILELILVPVLSRLALS